MPQDNTQTSNQGDCPSLPDGGTNMIETKLTIDEFIATIFNLNPNSLHLNFQGKVGGLVGFPAHLQTYLYKKTKIHINNQDITFNSIELCGYVCKSEYENITRATARFPIETLVQALSEISIEVNNSIPRKIINSPLIQKALSFSPLKKLYNSTLSFLYNLGFDSSWPWYYPLFWLFMISWVYLSIIQIGTHIEFQSSMDNNLTLAVLFVIMSFFLAIMTLNPLRSVITKGQKNRPFTTSINIDVNQRKILDALNNWEDENGLNPYIDKTRSILEEQQVKSYSNLVDDLSNQVVQLQGQVQEKDSEAQELRKELKEATNEKDSRTLLIYALKEMIIQNAHNLIQESLVLEITDIRSRIKAKKKVPLSMTVVKKIFGACNRTATDIYGIPEKAFKSEELSKKLTTPPLAD